MKKCDQCCAVYMRYGAHGGVVHEHGCPNARVINKCFDCGEEIVTTRGVNKRQCDDCFHNELDYYAKMEVKAAR